MLLAGERGSPAALVREAADRGPQDGEYVLSVKQPYCWLIARGYKPAENRSWTTKHVGLVWIHASKSGSEPLTDDDIGAYNLPDDVADKFGKGVAGRTGAIVAVAWLAGCYDAARLPPVLTGNLHAEGPCVLHFSEVYELEAEIPYRGSVGLVKFVRGNVLRK